jgi:hypothetical protein
MADALRPADFGGFRAWLADCHLFFHDSQAVLTTRNTLVALKGFNSKS